MNDHIYFKIISKLNTESLYNFSKTNTYFNYLCNFFIENKSNIDYAIYKKKIENFNKMVKLDISMQTTPNYEKFFLCLFLTNLFLIYYGTTF